MADVITGLTQVDATIEEVVASDVAEVLTAKMVVAPSVQDYTSMVRPGMDLLKIPRMGKFTVTKKVSGTAVDAQTNALSTESLPLDQHATVQFLVEDVATLQAKAAFVQAYVMQAGKDIAAEMDDYIIENALEATASAAAPDHRVVWDNATNLSKGDFTRARQLLDTQEVDADDRICLVSPLQEKALLDISEFTRVDESGSNSALRNGQIGKLFGFDVIMSSQKSDTSVLFYHKTTAAYARQMLPKVETDRDLPNLADRWSLQHLYGVLGGMDAGKRIVEVNATGT